MADIFIEANHSHPFPEGNGRTLQVFMSQLAAEQGLMMDYSNINQSLWNTASAVSGPHNRLFERVHLIPQNPDKRPIQNLFESIVQPLPQPNLQPLQDNKQTVGAKDFSPDKFQKLSDEYHKNSHLLSPLQKQVAAGASQFIDQLPPEIQIQAKSNLYSSQLAELKQSQHRPSEPSADVEIER